jgi:hypothetical protein
MNHILASAPRRQLQSVAESNADLRGGSLPIPIEHRDELIDVRWLCSRRIESAAIALIELG